MTEEKTETVGERGQAGQGISLRALRKEFRDRLGNTVVAINDLDLDVQPGEMVALLGPSGCGKSTTLRCIAGLEHPDSGRVEVDGRAVFDSASRTVVRVENRGVGMMFQSYALWPHMKVFDNVAYPLRSLKQKQALRERVMDMLDTVGCGPLVDRFPSELSGGQQQRVALARALVAEPRVVLFDEPLSNLDARLRDQMRFELLSIHVRLGFTGIYVTHDQDEALTVANRVVVMDSGNALQVGDGEDVYRRPSSLKVARFFGEAAEISGTVLSAERAGPFTRIVVDTWLGEVEAQARTELVAGDKAVLAVRPELVNVHVDPTDSDSLWAGTVEHISFLGPSALIVISVGDERLAAKVSTSEPLPEVGARIGMEVRMQDWLAFPEES